MADIEYQGSRYGLTEGESVLDGLLRGGVKIPHSCKAGSCGSCMLRAVEGQPTAASQAGLKDAWKAKGYFLACSCVPSGDLVVGAVDDDARVAAAIASVEYISPTVLGVRVACEVPFDYRPGQYLTLFREDGLARSYSIASLPADGSIELHVRLLDGGRMSGWLAKEATPGAPIWLQGPSGECFYVAGRAEQPVLLAGTGTGLAPLYGIVRDALAQGHQGPLRLFHGALNETGLYYQRQLEALATVHSNFEYTPTLLDVDGPIEKVVMARHPNLEGWRAYVCGDPAIVQNLRKKIFLAGAALNDIHADAFLPSV